MTDPASGTSTTSGAVALRATATVVDSKRLRLAIDVDNGHFSIDLGSVEPLDPTLVEAAAQPVSYTHLTLPTNREV